jgi:hypothetical protein
MVVVFRYQCMVVLAVTSDEYGSWSIAVTRLALVRYWSNTGQHQLL